MPALSQASLIDELFAVSPWGERSGSNRFRDASWYAAYPGLRWPGPGEGTWLDWLRSEDGPPQLLPLARQDEIPLPILRLLLIILWALARRWQRKVRFRAFVDLLLMGSVGAHDPDPAVAGEHDESTVG
jgi:hypothetical protein